MLNCPLGDNDCVNACMVLCGTGCIPALLPVLLGQAPDPPSHDLNKAANKVEQMNEDLKGQMNCSKILYFVISL